MLSDSRRAEGNITGKFHPGSSNQFKTQQRNVKKINYRDMTASQRSSSGNSRISPPHSADHAMRNLKQQSEQTGA